jgi:glycine cleavage system H protein
MSFILLLLVVVVFVTLDILRRKRKAAGNEGQPQFEVSAVTEIIARYFHPGHTWVLVSSSKTVKVGADDFSERMIGNLSGIDLPNVGKTVHQGEPLAFLHRGIRTLAQVSPISGKIVQVNERLIKSPSLLNASPLERGWIAKILPTELDHDLRNLLKGAAADGWREAVRMQLIHMFSPRIGTLMQDGGQLIENLGDQIPDDDWNRLVRDFFPIAVPTQTQTKPTN